MKSANITIAAGLLFSCIVLPASSIAREIDTLGCGKDYGPIKSVPPQYPRRAEARGIEGYIVMGFTIAGDGSVKDITVVDQEPRNTFVRSGMRAVESLLFPPCMVDGRAVEQAAVSIKYDFRIQ